MVTKVTFVGPNFTRKVRRATLSCDSHCARPHTTLAPRAAGAGHPLCCGASITCTPCVWLNPDVKSFTAVAPAFVACIALSLLARVRWCSCWQAPKYERFIRPTGLRMKRANVTHPELQATFQLEILGVKKNPQSSMYTTLGVITKGTVIEVRAAHAPTHICASTTESVGGRAVIGLSR